MKMTPKRQRADSAKAASAAVQAAAMPVIQPPSHVVLREGDWDFYEAIVLARPRDTWNDADLAVAVQLARTQSDIELTQKSIDEDGLIIDGKINPACELLDKMTRRSLAMARQLKVDTISTVGRAQDIHKGAELERNARAQADDDLIPRLRAI